MLYHIIAFSLGCLLDIIIGDPHWMPHPIRWIGNLIGRLEKRLNKNGLDARSLKLRGLCLVIIVVFVPSIICFSLMALLYGLNVYAGIGAEAIVTCYMLAGRSLCNESMKVYKALSAGDLEAARTAVSMIVGRDTDVLDKEGIIKATVETVAENTSDGVIAPLIYLALGGPILGVIYKSINTMDSMVGYKSERFRDFGYFAAKLDDVANYLPARISALCMILASRVLGSDYDYKNALRIFKRDRYKHASPNSAQCESVCAGALRIRLAGDASYFGKKVSKPYIGDALREIEAKDIIRANRLMSATAALAYVICMACMANVVM